MPRRRALTIAAISLAAVILFAGALATIAVQPGVIGSRAGLKVEHETWLKSKHGDVPCQDCHAAPGLAGQIGYDARMLGQMFGAVVGSKVSTAAFVPPTNAACVRCHKTLVTTSPKGDLIIPHRAHVEILNIPCVKCHAYLVHEVSPEGKHTPPMAVCLTCHDGKQAKDTCVTCHTAKAAPASHEDTATWLVEHPVAAKTTDCASCHGWVKDYCADCHKRRPPSHTADWRKTHGIAVASHSPRNCETCHTASFCSSCHGDVPKTNFNPSVTYVK